MAEVEAEIKPEVKPVPEVVEVRPPVVVENDGEEIVVKMALCRRVAGVIKCEPEGFRATYAKSTVGPTSIALRYPV